MPPLIGRPDQYQPMERTMLCNRSMVRGWWCSRRDLHDGPCALRPAWWNLPDLWRFSIKPVLEEHRYLRGRSHDRRRQDLDD